MAHTELSWVGLGWESHREGVRGSGGWAGSHTGRVLEDQGEIGRAHV